MEPENLGAWQENLNCSCAIYQIDTYNLKEHSITVHPFHTTFLFNNWKQVQLELCACIIQENFILMRQGDTNSFNLLAAGLFSASWHKRETWKTC
jgi:hypothetical protein